MSTRGYRGILLVALCSGIPLLLPTTAAAGISANTPALLFGPVVVGDHPEETVTLTNEEGTETVVGPARLEAEEPPGQFEIEAAECEGARLEEEQSCPIHVTFRPTAGGEMKAALVVESDANLIEVTLEGEGVAPELSIVPSPFDFGSVQPGSKSAEETFAVENVGTEDAAVETATLAGVDPDQFQITLDDCITEAVGVGGKCSVGVVFAPTSAGARSATLEVPSNAPESPATVALSGTGATAAPAPAVAQAKPSNAFGFGKVVFNKRRGTASLPVRVPGPGSLLLGGKGLIARSGPGSALVLGGAGTVRLAIVAAGSKATALDRTGRAKIAARVTYTPSGGDALTKTKKIGLVKRR